MENKLMPKDKRGVLGLQISKDVFVWFLILAVLAIAIILALVNLNETVDNIDVATVSVLNLTTDTAVNTTGAYLSGTSTLRNCALTVSSVINATNSVAINTANYTVSGCLITCTSDCDTPRFNNTLWNVTGSYTYTRPSANSITQNISSGLADNFFNQSGTIFAILIVVVIIAAIGIIIFIVTRFGGGGTGIGGGSGEFGSNTIAGV